MVKARNRMNLSISSNKSKKSSEIRKYETAYNKCIKMGMKSRQCKKSIKKLKPNSRKRLRKSVRISRKRSRSKSRKRRSKVSRKRTRTRTRTRSRSRLRSRKRSLNPYQRFVRKESSKSIYRGKSVKSRMRAISKLWKRSRN